MKKAMEHESDRDTNGNVLQNERKSWKSREESSPSEL